MNTLGSRKHDMMQIESGPEQTGPEQKFKSQRSWMPPNPNTTEIRGSDWDHWTVFSIKRKVLVAFEIHPMQLLS